MISKSHVSLSIGKKLKKGTIYTQSQIKKLAEKHPLCQPDKRNMRLGNHIRPRIIKSRFLKWPRYVQIQRKKRILLRRLKVPPAVAQFFRPLDQPTTRHLLEILKKYSSESRKQKATRLKKAAEEKVKGGEKKAKTTKKQGDKPISLKYGLKHVTYLIEQKKAKLVLIANDVEPIELVIFLPTLCKAMDIPYCIVQNKARLGKLVHKKSAAVVCLTDFKEHQTELANITRVARDNFNNIVQTFKKPEKGIKSQIRERQMAKILQAEAAKKS